MTGDPHEALIHELERRVSERTAELAEANRRLQQEIRDRQQVEIELRLAQKLEAVGQLAAGVAHEINTPVQYVGDSVHFLETAFRDLRDLLALYRERARAWAPARADHEALDDADEAADLAYLDAKVPRAFERIFDGTDRVTSIVRAMRDFARPDQREKAPADLNAALTSTLTVCRSEVKHAAEVETRFAVLPPVLCHIGDLNQVFLNLIVNAAHAVVESGRAPGRGGHIAISTELDGEDVLVRVRDSGCGIAPEVQPRVFDPFFTTKEVGRGTGQGLAISRAIVVDKHGGTLTFDTDPGRGTTFTVRLPIGREAAR